MASLRGDDCPNDGQRLLHLFIKTKLQANTKRTILRAKVDGKSDWSYLWRVMVPLAAPTLISITILKFMGTWNAYVWPNLVAEKEWSLISVGLRGGAFTNIDLNIPEYGYRMAASFVVTVPLFLLFIFFRKYIMRGVGRAGIKG